MPQADIHFRIHGNAGHIQLDRPKALNALSAEMVLAISRQLETWKNDARIGHVVISSSTPRAFCAGGDIRYARSLIMAGDLDGADRFFRNEYLADLAVAEFGKPVIALCNGVVMGGGAGLAQQASHVIMSETTKFAMPESAIGLFPDAGASLFFGRCPKPVARLLGTTGQVMNGADCLLFGLASAVTTSARMAELERALLASNTGAIDQVIDDHSVDATTASLQPHRQKIEHIFADSLTPEDMRDRADDLARLQPDDAFVTGIVTAFAARCPMSIKLFCRLMEVAADFTTASEALSLDFRLAMRMIRRPDFVEGIRAVVVDKDRAPKWSPMRLEDVDHAMLDAVFDDAGLPPLR
jgi:enoyl-CoA hydratase